MESNIYKMMCPTVCVLQTDNTLHCAFRDLWPACDRALKCICHLTSMGPLNLFLYPLNCKDFFNLWVLSKRFCLRLFFFFFSMESKINGIFGVFPLLGCLISFAPKQKMICSVRQQKAPVQRTLTTAILNCGPNTLRRNTIDGVHFI